MGKDKSEISQLDLKKSDNREEKSVLEAPEESRKEVFPTVIIGGYTRERGVIDQYGYTRDDVAGLVAAQNGIPFEIDSGHFVKLLDETGAAKEIELPFGLTVVFGVSNSGKSELIKVLSSQLKIPVLRFQEPELPTMMEPHALIQEIENFLLSPDQTVMAIDSFRFVVYNSASKSAAGKGGVNTGLYSDLTALSVSAAYRKKCILVVINPMSDDSSSEIVAKAIEGSVAGLFVADGYGSCSYRARTSSSMRTKKQYSYVVRDKDGSFTKGATDLVFGDSANTGNSGKDLSAVLMSRLLLKSK